MINRILRKLFIGFMIFSMNDGFGENIKEIPLKYVSELLVERNRQKIGKRWKNIENMMKEINVDEFSTETKEGVYSIKSNMRKIMNRLREVSEVTEENDYVKKERARLANLEDRIVWINRRMRAESNFIKFLPQLNFTPVDSVTISIALVNHKLKLMP